MGEHIGCLMVKAHRLHSFKHCCSNSAADGKIGQACALGSGYVQKGSVALLAVFE
jgi:hypothetical protein